ncbi:helix-turn-helix domain-containing protein [Rhodococcus sp. NPDC049939]|uniref:helix-turn-helix transcriptional regulator n=1 Tax=Rhodococcus sp. NPDC049939 TaxID=3155511 RepID=UPI003411D2A9
MATQDDDQILLTRRETAELLRISVRTLDQLAATGTGPPRCPVGGSVRYRRADVLAWIDAQVTNRAS